MCSCAAFGLCGTGAALVSPPVRLLPASCRLRHSLQHRRPLAAFSSGARPGVLFLVDAVTQLSRTLRELPWE